MKVSAEQNILVDVEHRSHWTTFVWKENNPNGAGKRNHDHP